jgi:long-subunit fatty acid transport protein
VTDCSCSRALGSSGLRRTTRNNNQVASARRSLIRRAVALLTGTLWGLSLCHPALAQATAQIPLQFDFLTPGARSLAMGGAFVGAADDATAAFANPAGLTQLSRKEISAEGRFRRIQTPFLQGGRVSGTVSGIGLDTIDGPSYGTDTDYHTSPAFLSLTLPAGPVTLAVYRHDAVGIENTFFSDGAFARANFAGTIDDRNRDLPLGGTRTVNISDYGGAFGVRLGDKLSVGGGVSVYTFKLASDFARYSFVSDVFSPTDRHIISATATQHGDAVALSANTGALFTLRPNVKIGAQFRRGPRFPFSQHDRVSSSLDLTRTGQFKVPDVASVGVEWRVGSNVRVLGDYARVQYSQLKKDFIDIQSLSSGRQNQLRIDSGNEVHGGVEYVLLDLPKPMALRAGAWFDPDHAVRYVPTAANDALDVLLRATLPGGQNLVHYTFGAGVALTNRIEFNAGADLSRRTTYVTASGVVRF